MAAAAPTHPPAVVVNTIARRGGETESPGDVRSPRGVCINHRLRHIIITDEDAHCVNVYSSDHPHDFITSWGHWGEGEGEFIGPRGVTCDSEDRVIVCDEGNSHVQIFTALGDFITQIRCRRNDGREYCPVCICVDDDDNIYVSGLYSTTIHVYSGGSSGELMRRFTAMGPGCRCTIHDNRLYRCDNRNSQVHIHSLPDGMLITSVSLKRVIGQYYRMGGITASHDGRLIVTDVQNRHPITCLIHVVTVSQWGRGGHSVVGALQTFTYNGWAHDVSILTHNTLVITDAHHDVVNTVELLGLSPPIFPCGVPAQVRSLQSIARTQIRTSMGADRLGDVDVGLTKLPRPLRDYIKFGVLPVRDGMPCSSQGQGPAAAASGGSEPGSPAGSGRAPRQPRQTPLAISTSQGPPAGPAAAAAAVTTARRGTGEGCTPDRSPVMTPSPRGRAHTGTSPPPAKRRAVSADHGKKVESSNVSTVTSISTQAVAGVGSRTSTTPQAHATTQTNTTTPKETSVNDGQVVAQTPPVVAAQSSGSVMQDIKEINQLLAQQQQLLALAMERVKRLEARIG